MTKHLGLSALLSCLALAGCIQATAPTTHSDQVTGSGPQAPRSAQTARAVPPWFPDPHALHVEADVEVIPRTFVTGAPIEIIVSVRNTSHEPAYIERCPVIPAWYDETGAWLGPFYACGYIGDWIQIPPGETYVKRFSEVGDWDPGRYKVYPVVYPVVQVAMGPLPLQHPFTVRILPAENTP